MIPFFLWALGCGGSTAPRQDSDAEDSEVDVDEDYDLSECEACLAAGGTYQPEYGSGEESCTEDCDVQDISCYEDECPLPCSEDCSGCFSESTCEAAGCQWWQQEEAMWCTD